MMKYQQKFSFRKFIKRVVFITLVLAITEVTVLLFLKSGKNRKNNPNSTVETKPTEQVPAAKEADDTSHFHSTEHANYIPVYSKPDKDTAQQILLPLGDSIADKDGYSSESIISDSIQKATLVHDSATQKNVYSRAKLTRSKMMEVYYRITAAKRRNHNKLNCVQVRKTASSNVVNALSIADFLQSKGYIISGRMTIGGQQKGISVNAKSGCIVVTVGSL